MQQPNWRVHLAAAVDSEVGPFLPRDREENRKTDRGQQEEHTLLRRGLDWCQVPPFTTGRRAGAPKKVSDTVDSNKDASRRGERCGRPNRLRHGEHVAGVPLTGRLAVD